MADARLHHCLQKKREDLQTMNSELAPSPNWKCALEAMRLVCAQVLEEWKTEALSIET